MSVAQGTPPDLPGYCARTFTLMPVGFTSQRSVQVSGFADIGLLTPLRRLYPLPVRQATALPSASSRFAVARDTLAVQLTLLLAECVEDFHLQVRAPCRAHQSKAPGSAGGYLLHAQCYDCAAVSGLRNTSTRIGCSKRAPSGPTCVSKRARTAACCSLLRRCCVCVTPMTRSSKSANEPNCNGE